MTSDAARELWGRWVAGAELSAEEQAGLVAALEADSALRAELLEDVQLDGALRALTDARRGGEAFAAAVADCLEPERDATRFIRKVEEKLAAPPPEPRGTGRDTRTNLPRVSRRFHRPGPASAGWKAALAAAGAFVAILLLATAFSTPASRRLAEAPRRPEPPVPAPLPAPSPEPEVRPQERLERIREEEKAAPLPSESEEERRARMARLKAEREALEAEMREAIARAKTAPEAPAPAPLPALPGTRSEAAAAVDLPRVEAIQGNVYAYRSNPKPRAQEGPLEPGLELWADGRSSSAVLRYADGTTVEIGPNTIVRDASDARGRRVVVKQGTVLSRIAKQPVDRPMVFATAHAEATVLGTTLRLTAGSDPKIGTTLEVVEGRVRLARLADGATVDVEAGRFAVAASTTELASRPAFPEDFVVNFGPANTPPSPQYDRLDAGGAFDPARGFGWDASRDGEPIEKGMWIEQGKPVQRTKGRATLARSLAKHGPLKGTDVYTGWEGHAETWKIQLPNGLYLVTVCVGDPLYEQGPHRIQVEDKVLVNNVITRETVNGGFYEGQAFVEVVDGELTMKVGGCRGKSSDGSSDTILNYIAIKRVPGRGK